MTSGAFILCSDINSLDLLKHEIINKNKKEKKRILFNLIIKSIINDNIITFLNSDDDIKNIIHKFCINYDYLKKWHCFENLNYIKIETFKEKSDIINFIKENSKLNSISFPLTKLITYDDYMDGYIYKYLHQKISYYYGNLSKETYRSHLDKLGTLIDYENEIKQLQKAKEVLLRGFKTFDIKNDSDLMDSLIIKRYTNDTLKKI